MNVKKKLHRIYLIQTIIIAALYVVLTYIANIFGMSNGIVQVRISDALAVLPYFTPAAIPGLFAGCFISNLITGTITEDVIFGSLCTLVGAIGSYLIRKHKFLVPIPPVISCVVVIPLLFEYAYRFEDSLWYFVVTVAIGEVVSCGLLGTALLLALEDYKTKLFPTAEDIEKRMLADENGITEEQNDNNKSGRSAAADKKNTIGVNNEGAPDAQKLFRQLQESEQENNGKTL